MFSSLVNLLFGGEAKQPTHSTPLDATVDVANVQDLGDSFLEEDYISSMDNGEEDKENAHELIDFETNEDDDWLLVSVSPGNRPQSKRESEESLESSMQETERHEDVAVEISEEGNTVEEGAISSEKEADLQWLSRRKKEYQEFWLMSEEEMALRLQPTKEELRYNWSVGRKPSVYSIIQKSLQNKNVFKISHQIESTIHVNLSQPERETCVRKTVDHSRDVTPIRELQLSRDLFWFLQEYTKYMRRVKNVSASQNGNRPTDFIPKLPISKAKRFQDILDHHPDFMKYYETTLKTPANPCLETFFELLPKSDNHQQATAPSKAEVFLKTIECMKPQQKARELDIRKYLAPSRIDRQNKVKLYEGKAKNNRRKDLWRCHSGANNNRKCC